MNVLGIDYGTQYIGIALGSTGSALAEPLATAATNRYPLSDIEALISKHSIEAIVVGVSEKTSATQAKGFAYNLEKIIKLPVYLIDETFSSQEAISKLAHKRRIKRASSQHAAAAAIILERWLESQS